MRPSLSRPRGMRPYRSTVFVATEGSVTEVEYLDVLRAYAREDLNVRLVAGACGKSSPRRVLARMREYLKRMAMRPDDQAWLVVDRDAWKPEDLDQLCRWAEDDARYHVAVSNPCFEFWLLLHFEEGVGVSDAEICTARLRKFCPDYSKHLIPGLFTRERIDSAVARAKRGQSRDNWPHACGRTTFHRLVEALLVPVVS